MLASPRPMYTLPSPMATPRLGRSGVSPFGNFARCSQMRSPLVASMAQTLPDESGMYIVPW